jgi:hypothetical protein
MSRTGCLSGQRIPPENSRCLDLRLSFHRRWFKLKDETIPAANSRQEIQWVSTASECYWIKFQFSMIFIDSRTSVFWSGDVFETHTSEEARQAIQRCETVIQNLCQTPCVEELEKSNVNLLSPGSPAWKTNNIQ